MKPKGRWIERYNLELDDKDLISKVLFNTSEILKVNVKPKVLWFIQHVYTSCSDNQLEDGEIFSDDGDGNAKPNLNYDEITCPIYVISDSEEVTFIYNRVRVLKKYNTHEFRSLQTNFSEQNLEFYSACLC